MESDTCKTTEVKHESETIEMSASLLSRKPTSKDESDEPKRPQWDNQIEFILSTLGYAVGLGNVWRFPFVVYENGGGTFLIPYLFMLFFAGLPIFFLELALGQYCGQGPIKVFGNLAPIFKGLGLAMICSSFLVGLYYNVIIAWTLFYLFSGMQSKLPWSDCSSTGAIVCPYNMTPTEYYFKHEMLGIKPENSWEKFGTLKWEMVLCLLGAWILVCLCLIKGIQSAGKVVYFTALFPFVVLIVLFGYGMSKWNNGASEGVLFYLKPDPQKLGKVKVWYDAAIQIFYSLGVSSGGLITLASYNKFDSNCYRDALLVAFLNCGTSVFAGFAIFAILGSLAHQIGEKVEDVAKSSEGLAFIAYPQAVSLMGDVWSQIMSFLFFLMLLTLGLDSMFTLIETVITAILDNFKQLIHYKPFIVIAVCSISFLLGLSMCAEGGFYMFELLANYVSTLDVLIFAIIELIIISWSYGVDNFLENIDQMNIRYPRVLRFYWKICWKFVTPLILFIVIIIQFIYWEPKYSKVYDKYIWPNNIQALGWLLPMSTIMVIPAVGFYQVFSRKSKGKKITVLSLLKKTSNWKPSPDSSRLIGEGDNERRISKRASRVSFRRHLPTKYEAPV